MKSQDYLIVGAIAAGAYVLWRSFSAAGDLGDKIAQSDTMQSLTDLISGASANREKLTTPATPSALAVAAAFRDAQYAAAMQGTTAPVSFIVPAAGETVFPGDEWAYIIWPTGSIEQIEQQARIAGVSIIY